MANVWLVEIMNPPATLTQKTFKIPGEVLTVGRFVGADLNLEWDHKVSRMHAKLAWEEGAIRLADLKSTNGTFVLENFIWNDIKKERALPSPSVIKFGDTIATVSYGHFIDEPEPGITKSLFISKTHTIEDKKRVESILVADLCDSSSIAEDKGDQLAYHMKKRMFQICDSVLTEYPANYTKNTGDGFFSVFSEPKSCLEAAVLILRRLAYRNRITKNPPIFIRLGIHYGETFVIDEKTNDRHGNDINIAFRIEGVQEESFGGQARIALPEKNRIIVSKSFIEAYGEGAQAFEDLGPAKLKGIKDPIDLYLFKNQ